MCSTGKNIRRRGIFNAEVLSNIGFCRGHYRIVLVVESFPPTSPGQFVQLQCRDLADQPGIIETPWPQGQIPKITQGELAGIVPFLRRPMSLAGRVNRADGLTELTIIYRASGTGTRWLAGLEAGTILSLIGPLGNSFTIRDDVPVAALVGGGVGIPPLVYLAAELAKCGKEVTAFCGARTAERLPLTIIPGARVNSDGEPSDCAAEFSLAGVRTTVCTDDGSLGCRGFVSDAFRRWLDKRELAGHGAAVYCCGPEAMMQAVAQICLARDMPCQLALERHMACGVGTCQSCAVKIRSGDPSTRLGAVSLSNRDRGWAYKLCCTDGPVFSAEEVLW